MIDAKTDNTGIAELFDLVGSEFDSNDATFSSHYAQMSAVCGASFLPGEISGKRILDAGCGTGTASVYFARNGALSVAGVDISEKSLAVGRKWKGVYGLDNLSFESADITALPFPDGSFDAVFSCGAIPYVRDVFGAIDEFVRVAGNRGILVLFLLKRRKMDGLYEAVRRILSRLPIGLSGLCANVIAFVLLPFAGLFLKRKVGSDSGKPLSQTVLENLFSPVGLSKVDPARVREYLSRKGFSVGEVTGITGVDFYSSETIFICKAKRR